MNYIKSIVIFGSIFIFMAACNQPTSNNSASNNGVKSANANSTVSANTQPTAADEFAATRIIYKQKCASCHKEDGTGGKVDIEGTIINAENLTTEKMKKMGDAKYIDVIENGIKDEGMPAYKGKLTEQEIKDVVKFIRKEFQKQ